MRTIIKKLPFLFFLSFSLHAFAADITGAGSSAAQPIYAKWGAAYLQQGGRTFQYQPIGSSAGIKKIKAGAVDFGASDVALDAADAEKNSLYCFPSAVSGVVPVFNLPGLKAGELQLTGEVLAAIFSGRILQWDDPAITAVNPGKRLPSLTIQPVVREDGSGTTYNFSDYLAKRSPEWKAVYGKDFLINWFSGVVKAKGSSGVSETVRKRPGAIGYIDYNYVIQDQLAHALVQNSSGRFVAPTASAFSSALQNSDWRVKADFQQMLTDRPGSKTWPITMGTFIIVPKVADDPKRAIATLEFFTWALVKGDNIVSAMDFVKLPDLVQARIYRELTTIQDKSGKPLQWSPRL